MGALIRVFFPLIGYFCVATVITLAAGYGYLRSNGTLDNEKMFRIVSLLHDVDLDEIATANQTDQQDVPAEEASYGTHQQNLRISNLLLQAKQDDIANDIRIFKALERELDNKFARNSKFHGEITEFLKEEKKKITAAGIAGVREQWEKLDARKQTKELLTKMFERGQMNTIISILEGMSSSKRNKILLTLNNPKDLEMLLAIQQEMLNGGPKAAYLDKKSQELSTQ